MNKNKISAIIWDFDSTLADTKLKNMNVTKQIIKKITGKEPEQFSVFDSLDEYFVQNTRTNWKYFYADAFYLTENEICKAAEIWTDYQQKNQTPIVMYDGIADLIKKFDNIPHGVVSMNSKRIITDFLRMNNVNDYFYSVVGYEEVGISNQKPKPDGILMCLQEMGIGSGKVFYIGDMECDVQCAYNAGKVLEASCSDIELIKVCARYDSVQELELWEIMPDHIVDSVDGIYPIINFYS